MELVGSDYPYRGKVGAQTSSAGSVGVKAVANVHYLFVVRLIHVGMDHYNCVHVFLSGDSPCVQLFTLLFEKKVLACLISFNPRVARYIKMVLRTGYSIPNHYASRRSHTRDTVKLTVCVCVYPSVPAVTAQRL